MTAERILQSDVLDILFEDRNKTYGAYDLRRTYPHRIKRAVIGMFFLVAVGSASYLFGSQQNVDQSMTIDILDTTKLVQVNVEDKKEIIKPPEASAPRDLATVKNNIPQIVPDIQVPKPEVPDMKQIDSSAYGDITVPGEATTGGEVVNSDPGPGDGGIGKGDAPAAPQPAIPTGPIDMRQADEMPEYPGGSQALVRYMVNNLTSELEPGVKYVIRAQFVIDEEGKVSEAVILSSDEANLNNQVLKALRKMKQWKPGKLHGRSVAVRFTMPVTFMGPEE